MVKANLSDEYKDLRRSLHILQEDITFIRTHMSSYLGDGIALTYLDDETPIHVNANDFGCPINFISGGKYEEENLNILLSFVRDDTVFVDIGANLGFFSLKVGRRVNRFGKVYAFEPHQKLAELLRRSAYMNGLSNVITCYQVGLSDKNGVAIFAYPPGHLGGGSIGENISGQFAAITSEIRTLDDVLGSDFKCDLMKIDVEGHELSVLRGMPNVLKNSDNLKIMLEKLTRHAGYENDLYSLLQDAGYEIYAVQPDVSLQKVALADLEAFSGYILAARNGVVVQNKSYFKMSIFPGQLSTVPATCIENSRRRLVAKGKTGELLVHGPYWYLARGIWRFVLHGEIRGAVSIAFATRFGHVLTSFKLHENETEKAVVIEADLVHFECIVRAAGEASSVTVYEIELIREG